MGVTIVLNPLSRNAGNVGWLLALAGRLINDLLSSVSLPADL
jgi:hypothetical protein